MMVGRSSGAMSRFLSLWEGESRMDYVGLEEFTVR